MSRPCLALSRPFHALGGFTELMRVGQVTAWIFYRAGLHRECAVQLRIPDAVAVPRVAEPFHGLGGFTELMQALEWRLHRECAVQLRIPDAVAIPRVAEPFHGLGSFNKQWHDHGARVDVNLWSQFPPSTGHVCLVTSASEWTLMRRWSLMCSVACCRLQVCW